MCVCVRAVCHVSLCFECCAQTVIKRSVEKTCKKSSENHISFSKNWRQNWSASERLLQHLEASQGLGMALETYKAQLARAIQPQKSLPESSRVAPGMSLGHFCEAWGRHCHEKTSTKMRFRRSLMIVCRRRRFSRFLDRILDDF